jgi:hypothetical protein
MFIYECLMLGCFIYVRIFGVGKNVRSLLRCVRTLNLIMLDLGTAC